MNSPDRLDEQALASARQHMGRFAWPTAVLGLTVACSYCAVLALSLTGQMPMGLAIVLIAVLTYLAYTVLHEAAHGTISGSNPSLRWLNETLGYIAAWILMVPLTAHRHEHLAHHRNTNKADSDPDYVVGELCASPLKAPLAATRVFAGQFSYYLEHRWHKAPSKQNLYYCLEIAAALLPRLALVASGFWLDSILLFGLAWLVGLSVTLYLFAYIVHQPHTDVGRYIDTSTILVRGWMGKVVTGLWMCQNYHSIHHLFPRVPFYRYPALFAEIEPVMNAKGAPIHQLSFAGLSPKAKPAPVF